MPDVGVVVIGRNEGERLRRCLRSAAGWPVVYVDSASSDDSVAIARAAGVEVVEIDASAPLSAARGRNAGLARLIELLPEVRLVQFVDGDSELAASWIERGAAALAARADVAVVCGRRRERTPSASIFHRAAEVEWNAPPGDVPSCGGDALMRVEALRLAGGFDESVVAGEEPELCQRLRRHGFHIVRLDAEMTTHDSGDLGLPAWWARSVRSGYGSLDVASRFGEDGLFVRQVRSTRVWSLGWPASVFAASLISPAAAALAFLALPLQMMRLALAARRRSGDWQTAMSYGVLTMIGKWAQLAGQLRYRRARATRLVERES